MRVHTYLTNIIGLVAPVGWKSYGIRSAMRPQTIYNVQRENLSSQKKKTIIAMSHNVSGFNFTPCKLHMFGTEYQYCHGSERKHNADSRKREKSQQTRQLIFKLFKWSSTSAEMSTCKTIALRAAPYFAPHLKKMHVTANTHIPTTCAQISACPGPPARPYFL